MFRRKKFQFGVYDHPGNSVSTAVHRNKKRLFIRLGLIFLVPIIAVVSVLYIFRIYHVEGSSMDDTLRDGQRIIISKWPKTSANLRGKKYVPNRYDIVVLKDPTEDEQIIKRVIALPGERVKISSGTAYVFNDQHPEGWKVDDDAPAGVVTFGEKTDGYADVTLGENEIFVLGDNREVSVDSRAFGPISIDDIVGKY